MLPAAAPVCGSALALALAPAPRRPRGPSTPGRCRRPVADSVVADARERARARPAVAGEPADRRRCSRDSTRRTPDRGHPRRHRREPVGRLARGDPAARRAALGRHRSTTAAARLLLARAALEQRRRFGRPAPRPGRSARRDRRRSDGERLVLLATALDRLDARDSAAATYARAAERLPSIADWLRIRAAAVTDDSAARARLYARIDDPLARERIALERGRRPRAHRRPRRRGARATPRLGARATALRLRLALEPRQRAARGGPARSLAALVAARRQPGEVRDAIAPARQRLRAAHAGRGAEVGSRGRGSRTGAAARPTAFAAAFAAASVSRGSVRLRHRADPARPARATPRPSSRWCSRRATLAARAAYQRARALVRDGQRAQGRTALARDAPDVSRATPPPPRPRSSSWAIWPRTTGPTRQARRLLPAVVARGIPPAASRRRPRFRAAMIALLAGDAGSAGRRVRRAGAALPAERRGRAAVYWAGRAWAAAGDTAAARARWERLADGDPVSYYTGLAVAPARPLGLGAGSRRPDSFVADSRRRQRHGPRRAARAPGPRRRVALGVRPAGARQSDTSPERLLALANAFRAGRPRRRRPSSSPAAPWPAARRPTPAPIGCSIRSCSRTRCWPRRAEHGLDAELRGRADPAGVDVQSRRHLAGRRPRPDAGHARPRRPAGAVAGVSGLGSGAALPAGREPAARRLSPAGAGRPLRPARSTCWPRTTPAPAGSSAGRRRIGVDDPEVFTERIPFVETRGYVRAIQRNQEIYRALYHWPDGRT